MGDAYTMETVASVVVGGTLMSGGKASISGTFVGCLFLGIIVTAMQVLGFGSGVQKIAKGALIIIILTIGAPKWIKGQKLYGEKTHEGH